MSYRHLNQNERYLIGHLHAFGRSIRQIAKELERAPGTISRELKRNQLPSFGTYHGPDAHRRALRRRSEAHRLSCLDQENKRGRESFLSPGLGSMGTLILSEFVHVSPVQQGIWKNDVVFARKFVVTYF